MTHNDHENPKDKVAYIDLHPWNSRTWTVGASYQPRKHRNICHRFHSTGADVEHGSDNPLGCSCFSYRVMDFHERQNVGLKRSGRRIYCVGNGFFHRVLLCHSQAR